jgi:predicted component of type VI protein secretion system
LQFPSRLRAFAVFFRPITSPAHKICGVIAFRRSISGVPGIAGPLLRMAYVIIYHKDQEVARQELNGPATVGRSPECELRVHDILLSRRHCQIEPEGDGWAILDLGSKNGTRIGGDPVFRRRLADCDVIRMGKTAIRFRTGPFIPAPCSNESVLKRPADPFEALSGTVSDFTYRPAPIGPTGLPFPAPRPSPREPAAYVEEDVRSLVSELVSSSWDSIYEGASRPDPMVAHAQAAAERAVGRKRPREPRVDLAMQVDAADAEAAIAIARVETEDAGVEVAVPVPLPLPPLGLEPISMAVPPARAPRARMGFVLRRIAVIFQWMPFVLLPLLRGH